MLKLDEARRRKDGRVARSHRTVEQIITAFLELVERDGYVHPTAHLVARRAGVSRRGLYLHFRTIEDLVATAAERRAGQAHAAWQSLPTDVPLDKRIHRFCRRWAALLEHSNPVRRAAAVHEGSSPRIAASTKAAHQWANGVVERTFQPELEAVTDDDRDSLVTALHQATSCSAWDDIRRDGCDVPEGAEAMGRLLTALFRPHDPDDDPAD